ncbi:hypothetical protein ABBQ32_005834 [Trebouxia sp. C0010 RCD-2024]
MSQMALEHFASTSSTDNSRQGTIVQSFTLLQPRTSMAWRSGSSLRSWRSSLPLHIKDSVQLNRKCQLRASAGG